MVGKQGSGQDDWESRMQSHTGSSSHFRALLIDWTAAIGVRRGTPTLSVADFHLHDHQGVAIQ